ncbi:DUF1007 family protein [Aestuariivirga sp.]|uniref:DUF1007 family protein n=1 Tax=Aestuariivirga sp. TaxID=2650926 RepID=UPI0039E2A513
MKQVSLALLLMVFTASCASAHPHVWADMRSIVLFNPDGEITGTRVEWTFDKGYSAQATDGLDTDGDGKFSAAELAPLTAVNLSSLKTYGYFIFMRMNGQIQKFSDAIDPDQDYANGRLTLRFTIPLQHPLDPREGEFSLKVYDPEFFIDFEYPKTQGAKVSGAMPKSCHMKLTPIPTSAQLDQTMKMLATKGVDWKPADNEDFGGLFAQAVDIACAP